MKKKNWHYSELDSGNCINYTSMVTGDWNEIKCRFEMAQMEKWSELSRNGILKLHNKMKDFSHRIGSTSTVHKFKVKLIKSQNFYGN